MLHRHAALPSTQDEAHRLALAGAPHGTAVVAAVQTGGRGTRGRPWASGEGGLWLSVVCRPEATDAVQVLGLRAGLALAEALEGRYGAGLELRIKWPNDLLAGGRKLAGILTEARWQGDRPASLVIGVGLNVRNPLPPDLAAGATCLADLGVAEDPAALAGPIAEAIAESARAAAELSPGELERFAARDWLRGRALVEPAPGVADGIAPGGQLRIRDRAGRVREALGTVRLAEVGR